MKQLRIMPADFACRLAECSPGLFIDAGGELCLKTAYNDVYICDGGSAFWGGVASKDARADLLVTPCYSVWENADS